MSTIRRHEYLVLYACFSEALSDPAPLLRTCYDLSRAVVGDRLVWAQLFGARASTKGKSVKFKGRLSEYAGVAEVSGTLRSPSFMADTQKSQCDHWGIEYMWRLLYEVGGVWHLKHPPYVHVVFAFSLLGEDQIRALSTTVREFLGAFHGTGCCTYAVAAIGDERQTGCGGVFETVGQNIVHFEHEMMRLAWLQSGGPRRNKVRGVYWGNLLSPAMVEQLGGAALLSDEYRAMECGINRELTQVFPDGAVALYLSARVTDFLFPHMGLTHDTFERGAWLYRRFAAGGLLPGT